MKLVASVGDVSKHVCGFCRAGGMGILVSGWVRALLEAARCVPFGFNICLR